ncbi:MAG: site-specific integrase [Sulfurimonas sp.]
MIDNTNEFLKQIKTCVTPKQIRDLAAKYNIYFPQSDNSHFNDDELKFVDPIKKFKPHKLPKNSCGLAAKMVLYLKLVGLLGDKPYGSGAGKICVSFSKIFKMLDKTDPRSIDMETIDYSIQKLIDKGLKPTSIKRDFILLEHWRTANEYLPYFLQIDPSTLDGKYTEICKAVNDYYKNTNYLEDSRDPYPLHLLNKILSKSIHLVENYMDDAHELINNRDIFKDASLSATQRTRATLQYFQSTEHNFSEPKLKYIQDYMKSNESELWKIKTIPGSDGTIKTIDNFMSEMQGATLTVLLFFTAARSQEIHLLNRFPKIIKTEHHDLDESYNLTRIVYKTDRYGKKVNMPIPKLGLDSIEFLSRKSEAIDGKKTGSLNLAGFTYISDRESGNNSVYDIIKAYSKSILEEGERHLSPHDLRRAMAFLIGQLNDRNGLELAMMMLAHSSDKMAMTYQNHNKSLIMNTLSHIASSSEDLRNALEEYQSEDSERIWNEVVVPNLEKKEPMFGPIAKRLFKNVVFTGHITDDFTNAVNNVTKYGLEMIRQGRMAVIQTPTCLCIHDLTQPEKMQCQRGIKADDFEIAPVMPAACVGPICGNALYTSQNVEILKSQTDALTEQVPDDLKERLGEWLFYVGDGMEDPRQKIINEYDHYMENMEASNG